MLYQLTAYDVLGALVVQVTTADTTADGFQWTRRLLEQVDISERLAGEPWDVVWLLGQLLSDRAMEQGARRRRED